MPLSADAFFSFCSGGAPPGGGSEGVIQHEGEEFGYVLDGEIELTVDNRNYQLREGDSFYFRSERPHSYNNNRKKFKQYSR